ncbi:MAG: glutamate--cysteine ligase [Fusobacteriaceae bacterium]|jgi:glutamate--cysteine ligase|nr:glutamate--cysteine ligase [Fusobacteriaceae bacterium]
MELKIKEYLFNIIEKLDINDELLQGNFGIEKENTRVNKNGELALTKHPKIFGDKLKNPYITVDFSESQIEMITPIFDIVENAHKFMHNLHEIVSLELKDEYLWPQSLPGILPSEKEIPIAEFDDSKEGKYAYEYRKYLAEKYGKKLQLLSGIHFNFSFKDEFLLKLFNEINKENTISYKDFKNEVYLKITRNYLKYRWILIYLIGASSPIHNSYREECIVHMNKLTDDSFFYENALSFRNSKCGYKNKERLDVDYTSIDAFIKSIKTLISQGKLRDIKEYYSPIRLKTKNPKNPLEQLSENGIEYLEIRMLDLNPFNKIGLELKDLEFIHLFLIFCLFEDEKEIDMKKFEQYDTNHDAVAINGNMENIKFVRDDGSEISIKEKGYFVINSIKDILNRLNINNENIEKVLNYQKEKIDNKEKTYISKLIKEVKENGFINFHLEKAKEYLEEIKKESFNLKGYEDLELSTQIVLKEAIKRGIKFEILDREENFILLDNGIKKEYIKQATKTSLDSYSTVLIMENKLVTKKVLEKNNIKVPFGEHYIDINKAKKDYYKYRDMKIVVKPKSTNFGLGISIFTEKPNQNDYEKAIEIAFKEDNSILIEEYIEGKEYRFVVMGDRVVAILHRVPANVKGDGIKTIKELVEEKNKDFLRGEGYKKPLEKIKLGEVEQMFLKNQNKSIDYIPQKNEIVYLRENSNISTGGDSIDYTDIIPEIYKEIAIQSAKAVDAKICGVDMMIKDINNINPEGNYAIIELNFNPAIHIHCYPYQGKDRKLGKEVLDLLGF